jgi:hypothetical protein
MKTFTPNGLVQAHTLIRSHVKGNVDVDAILDEIDYEMNYGEDDMTKPQDFTVVWPLSSMDTLSGKDVELHMPTRWFTERN